MNQTNPLEKVSWKEQNHTLRTNKKKGTKMAIYSITARRRSAAPAAAYLLAILLRIIWLWLQWITTATIRCMAILGNDLMYGGNQDDNLHATLRQWYPFMAVLIQPILATTASMVNDVLYGGAIDDLTNSYHNKWYRVKHFGRWKWGWHFYS